MEAGGGVGTGDRTQITRSTRDLPALRARLEAWLAGRLPAGARPRLSALAAPPSNGMSSETLLFDAAWHEGDTTTTAPLVARVAPEASAVPVFSVYDLDRQFQVMRLVVQHTDVPVPGVLWSEPGADALGAPFFVMERVDGQVPPDNLPYTFGSWLTEAAPADLARLARSSIEVLARLHAIERPEEVFSFLRTGPPGQSALAAHVADQWSYYRWVAGEHRSPLIERGFAWLEDHWPAEETPTTLSWGDARIGNIMYRDFEPVAVLDWEMAALAPPEVDLGWFIFLHRFFQDLATGFGLPGMPGFLDRGDVASTYESLSGHAPRDLDFYIVHAAVRHAIVMTRTQQRAIHFGEAVMPADADDLILHRPTLERLLSGTYWS